MAATFHPAVSALLQSLSAAIGETVQLDTHGECFLEFGAGVDLVLAQAGEPHILSLRSPLMATRQPPDAGMLQACLSLNYTHLPPSYCIALDEDSHQLALLALIDAPATSPEDFQRLIAGFLDLVPRLRERLDGVHDNEPPHALVGAGTLA